MDEVQWAAVDALIAERDPYCRGVLILGQRAGVDALADAFRAAGGSRSCRGFAVGRTIFEAPAKRWLAREIDDAALVREVRTTFEALIDAWQAERPHPNPLPARGESEQSAVSTPSPRAAGNGLA
jgi:5-dehydro-2-deoxygluconokinase